LDNIYRAAIFFILLENGELSFSSIQKELDIDKAKLAYHLRKLGKSALVEHYYKQELGNEEYSFYSLSRFGDSFWKSLINSLQPEPLFRISEFSVTEQVSQPETIESWKMPLTVNVTGSASYTSGTWLYHGSLSTDTSSTYTIFTTNYDDVIGLSADHVSVGDYRKIEVPIVESRRRKK
jgi:DNA-binding MarR family transcriptional regulator